MPLLPIELYTNPTLNLATTWLWWISVVTWGSWWRKWSCTSVIYSHLQGFCRRKRTPTGQAPQSFAGLSNHQQVRRLKALLVVEWGSPPLELLAPPSSASSCPCPSHLPASQQSTALYSPLRSLMANIHTTMPSLYKKDICWFFLLVTWTSLAWATSGVYEDRGSARGAP